MDRLALALAAVAWLVPASVVADPAAADALFTRRDDVKALEAATDAYEAAGKPVMVLRCVFLRLHHFDDLKDKEARRAWMERGLKAGEAALRTNDVPGSLATFAGKDAPALLWYAAIYGRKIEVSETFKQIGMVKHFRHMLERAAELDGGAYFGGPWRMLGNFHAEAPVIMGGDWDKALRELDRAVAAAPDFFDNRLVRAEYAHVHRKDREAFRRDIRAVLDARDDVLPEVVPEQRKAQADARKLLAREPELFGD